MNYKYDIKGKESIVWNWDDDFHDEVILNENNHEYLRTIRTDKNGKFFTWNKEKIYLNNFKYYTIEELNEKIDNYEFITADDICQTFLKEGIENVIISCLMNPIDLYIPQMGVVFYDTSKQSNVDCYISEEHHKVKDNYKIELISIVEGYVKDKYYLSDFVSFVRSGKIKIHKK